MDQRKLHISTATSLASLQDVEYCKCYDLIVRYSWVVFVHLHYSKTSNNGPSEKRTTSLQRTAHLPPIDF